MAQWYYQVMDELLGPVSLDELKDKLKDGEIDDGSLVRQGTGGEWATVSDIDELKQAMFEPVDDDQPADEPQPADDRQAGDGGTSPDKTTPDSEVEPEPTADKTRDVKRSPLALRPCSDCGTMVSMQASACPKCGRSFHESSVEVRYKGEQPIPILALFAILAIIFVIVTPVAVCWGAMEVAERFNYNDTESIAIGASTTGIYVALAIVCTLMGGAVGKPRMAYLTGLFLGLFFGPLGVFVAAVIDKRPKCAQCSNRLTGLPRECSNCHSRLIWKVERRWY